MAEEVVEVVFPYASTDVDQMNLTLGEKITVIKKGPSGWWIGRDARGQVGTFLAAYTRPAKEKPKFAVPKELKTAMLHESCASVAAAASGFHTMLSNSSSSGAAVSPLTQQVATPGLAWSGAARNGTTQHDSSSGGSGPVSGAYKSMTQTDQDQLKRLLGLEDDDDPVSSPSPEKRSGSSGALTSSDQRLAAMDRLMQNPTGYFNQGAGNHRSLFDAGSLARSGQTQHRRTSLVGDAGGNLVERVIAMRRELKTQEVLYERIKSKEDAARVDSSQESDSAAHLKLQVEQLKMSIQHRQLVVADLEKRVDVLRAVCDANGSIAAASVPPYDPLELANRLRAVYAAGSQSHNVTPQPSTSVTPAGSPRHGPLDAEEKRRESSANDPAAATADGSGEVASVGRQARPSTPSEEQIEGDPVSKKLVRKLRKRIAECEDTKTTYNKQYSKMKKRIQKHKAAAKQIDEEIALLQTTLAPSAGRGGDEGDDGATASSSGTSEPDVDPSDSHHTSTKHLRIAEKRFRKLIPTLTEEELADMEKYQLAEIKLQQKIAKLKEQLEGGNSEVAALKAQIDKFRKRLSKGDDAMQVLVTEKQDLQKRIREVEQSAQATQDAYVKAQAALADAQEACRRAHEIKQAAANKAAQDRLDLSRRVEKERERLSGFEAELARLLAAAAQPST